MAFLTDRTGLPDDERDTLTRALERRGALADVVRWALAAVPPRLVADVVVQDEFTHDVVIPWAAPRWLVFDST